MPNQKSLELEQTAESKTFRTVHYLGSKLRILDFIKNVVDELDPDNSGVCDLFSGSGSVSQHLSSERKILSIDIQQYSNIICSALLNPIQDDVVDMFVEMVQNSGKLEANANSFKSIISLEESLINQKTSTDLESVCNFIENCSLYSALLTMPEFATMPLSQSLKLAIKSVEQASDNKFLAVKYFGGLYFSYKQAAHLDAILECINETDKKYQNILMAALLSTASDIVNTVGKQFAQPIRPRNKNGDPKLGLVKQLGKDRNLDVITVYQVWLKKYSQRQSKEFNHEVLKLDYKEALDRLDSSIGVVYADPPYTRDHYSRFYHGLETLCLGDHPLVSKTNIGGTIRLSRGMYREDRHQSEFCIKSKAPQAFETLFKKVSKLNKILLLSYSPYDKSKGAHPRVVELEYLESLASQYFNQVEVRSPGKFSHSKLNRSDLHLQSEDVSEVLLVCRN
jgi:adenine-specific DNA methylase